MDLLRTNLSEYFTPIIELVVAKMSASVSTSFEKMVDNKISSSYDSISKACDGKISQSHCAITSTYDHKIAQLDDEVNKLNPRLDDQDTQSRSKSLVLFGVVEATSHESSSETDLGSLRVHNNTSWFNRFLTFAAIGS